MIKNTTDNPSGESSNEFSMSKAQKNQSSNIPMPRAKQARTQWRHSRVANTSWGKLLARATKASLQNKNH